MEFESYQQFWNHQATTPESALAAVDGSASEEVVQTTGRYTARQVATAIDLDDTDSVLELGCGVGRIGRELAPRCNHWTGVDISSKMIAHARERLAQLSRTLQAVSPLEVIGRGYSVLTSEDGGVVSRVEQVAQGDGHEVVAHVQRGLVAGRDTAHVVLAGRAGHHLAEGEDEQ